jgi:hypothetical protein
LPEGVERKVVVESTTGEVKEVEGVSMVADIFNTFIPECKTVDELRGFWGSNKGAIDALKSNDEGLYSQVLANFTSHKDSLEAKGEAA